MTSKKDKLEKKELTSTDILMSQAKEAEAAAQLEAERDAKITRLCYERSMQQYYEYEGLDPDQEEKDKQALIEKEKEIQSLPFGKEVKYRFNVFLNDMKNPTKKKIRYNRALMVVISILRAVILFGLCFIIVMPIIEKMSYAFRHPLDISNPQVLWIPETWSTMNIRIATSY